MSTPLGSQYHPEPHNVERIARWCALIGAVSVSLTTIARAEGISITRVQQMMARVGLRSSDFGPQPISDQAWFTVEDFSRRTEEEQGRAAQINADEASARWIEHAIRFDRDRYDCTIAYLAQLYGMKPREITKILARKA